MTDLLVQMREDREDHLLPLPFTVGLEERVCLLALYFTQGEGRRGRKERGREWKREGRGVGRRGGGGEKEHSMQEQALWEEEEVEEEGREEDHRAQPITG